MHDGDVTHDARGGIWLSSPQVGFIGLLMCAGDIGAAAAAADGKTCKIWKSRNVLNTKQTAQPPPAADGGGGDDDAMALYYGTGASYHDACPEEATLLATITLSDKLIK